MNHFRIRGIFLKLNLVLQKRSKDTSQKYVTNNMKLDISSSQAIIECYYTQPLFKNTLS